MTIMLLYRNTPLYVVLGMLLPMETSSCVVICGVNYG